MPGEQPPAVLHEHVSCEVLLTSSCNMRCSYCIAKELPRATMSRETAEKAIDMFVHLATGAKLIEFTFTGGEPLMTFHALEAMTGYAVERTQEAGMQATFVLKTNGTVLDSRIIDFIREHSMRVVVSIDGVAAVHDKHRRTANGKGTHHVICRNLLDLMQNQIPCVASLTVHPDSSRMVPEGVRYLHGLGLEHIDIGPAYGTVTWADSDIVSLNQSLIDAATYMHQMNRTDVRIEVGPLYRQSEHVGGLLSDRWGCHAASTNLAFLPNGQIAGCSALAMIISRFPELVLGDVCNGIDQIAIDRLLHLAQTNGDCRPACRGCDAAPNCTGGCLAINYSTSGIPLIPPAVYCQTVSTIPEAWKMAWQEN